MNVLIINASPRKKGVTSALLSEIEKSINAEHSVEAVRIYGLNIKPCIGCLKCRPDKPCTLPDDDAHILARKIKEANALVIGSPVYWGNIPGPLKTFFDRNVTLFEYAEAKSMNYVPTPQLRDKKAYLVTTSASPFPYNLLPSQSRGTLRALRTVLRAGGVRIAKTLNVPDSFNFPEKKQKYLEKAQKLARSI